MAFRVGEWRPLSINYSPGGIIPIGLVLHVQAGNGEPFGWFSNPTARASSNWWVGKDGRIVQYVDPDTGAAWTQGVGNSQWVSVETEGWPSEALTPAQVECVATIYAAGVERYGWPVQLSDSPTTPGLGWHGMGGAAWGAHYGCPGDARLSQRPQILALVNPITGGLTMSDIAAILTELANLSASVITHRTATEAQTNALASYIKTQEATTRGAIDGLAKAIAAIPGQPLSADQISAAVKAGVAAAIGESIAVEGDVRVVAR